MWFINEDSTGSARKLKPKGRDWGSRVRVGRAGEQQEEKVW